MDKSRCKWANSSSEETKYHDNEWGVPVHDDIKLFEFLILEGVQAGLSWLTVLKKREHYCIVYDGFDPAIVATYDTVKQQELLSDAGIIRNRLKVAASIKNAKAFLEIQNEFGSFNNYIWGFVDGKPIVNKWKSLNHIPAKTELSDKISKDLKKRGFSFVGTTIIYAFLQAIGIVNDHEISCFRYSEV